MSTFYSSEPSTKGKVILHTSFGDVDIELWPKEAPLAVRNFVQLCLEGYYDNTIFHRVVKDFMIQGGDPTGTGRGGESIYDKPFKDEFHTRLKFTHRGIVAMANSAPNSNGSQFFITLAETKWLDNKHTIFGKVTGNTIYNVVEAGNVETEGEKPKRKLILKTTEVLSLPFDDIYPRNVTKKNEKIDDEKTEKEKEEEEKENNRKKSKIKPVKNLKLLSFGDEAEEEEETIKDSKFRGIKSAHDVLNDDPMLQKKLAIELDSMKVEKVKENEFKKKILNRQFDNNNNNSEDALEKMREKQKELEKKIKEFQPDNEKEEKEREKRMLEIEKLKIETKKARDKLLGRNTEEEKKEKRELTEWEKLKAKYKTRKEKGYHTEDQTIEKLNNFRSKLEETQKAIMPQPKVKIEEEEEKVEVRLIKNDINTGERYEENGTYLPPVEPPKDDDADDDKDEEGDEWMKHELKLKKHFEDFYRTGDASYNPSDDNYVTIDPLQKQEAMEEALAKHKRERDGDWDKKEKKVVKKFKK